MECRVHKLVADVSLFAGDRVLLMRYQDVRRYDGQRGWFVPDDYLAHGEHPEDGAKRIAREQAGIELGGVRLSHIESFGNGAWHLIFHYVAAVEDGTEAVAGENVAEHRWFAPTELPAAADVAHEGWALDIIEQTRASLFIA